MPTFPIIKINAIEIRFHALILILAIALIIFDTDFKNYLCIRCIIIMVNKLFIKLFITKWNINIYVNIVRILRFFTKNFKADIG